MATRTKPLDSERLFVAYWGWRTHVRTAPTREEEDHVTTVAARYGPPWAESPRLPRSRSAGRSQPSAAARRCRAAAALVAVAAIGALFGAGSLAGAGQAAPTGAPVAVATVPVSAASHVVQPGDTLWALARRLQPAGDVHPLVARLRTASGGGPLVPGQRIRITA